MLHRLQSLQDRRIEPVQAGGGMPPGFSPVYPGYHMHTVTGLCAPAKVYICAGSKILAAYPSPHPIKHH